jgi:signal transduction histidine kinase/CheY-like chemotaxis protein
MSRFRRFLAVSFRAKVLVPVIFVMICLLAVTALVVNWRINKQFENEARATLAHADEGFMEWRNQRNGNLITRTKNLREDPRFQNSILKGEKFIQQNLPDILSAAGSGVDLMAFTSAKKKLIGAYPEDPLLSIPTAEFEAASDTAVELALKGQDNADIIHVGEKLYAIVSIPVPNANGDAAGALTGGMEIGQKVADEISHFTRSKIVLLAGNHVIAHTLSTTDANRRFVNLFRNLSLGVRSADGPFEMKKELFDGDHYYCTAGRFNPNSAGSPGYLLLYSYEESWRALQTTQKILVAANAIAIVLGSLLICFLVGMVTRPLRELRDTAEAVGRGDFSRRVKVRYDDECGELARVFNRMTENLKHSRAQLESTVETLKTTQAQLIQSEKLSGIGEFIAGVAHELNNPLTSVMGFSELLQNASVAPAEKRYLEMIHKSALRCQKIVQALLGFARRSTPERKAVCVNQLAEAAVEILFYQLRTSNVEAILNLDPNLPHAMVDPHQIQQVFVNLINNARQAIEAHQPKGRIKVSTEQIDGHVRIIIQDNGPGISEQNLSKIFDPFFTTKEVGKGTGLGLSLVYGIIKEHGGSIVPRSRPGEGATFTIELPVTAKPAEVAVEISDPMIQLGKGREGVGKRVLVIDDEEPILQMVREALTPQGYEVDIAPDGVTALRCLAEKQYDVALCDWKMPGLSGQQVYERARAVNPALSDRIIFITGDIINERTRKFLEQQNKICLPKPFTIAEFRLAIKKVLSAE